MNLDPDPEIPLAPMNLDPEPAVGELGDHPDNGETADAVEPVEADLSGDILEPLEDDA